MEVTMAQASIASSISRPLALLPTLDRRALMRDAHQIARDFRRHYPSYREALAYGLWAAWKSAKVRRDFRALNDRAGRPAIPHTARQIELSRRATRQCGSSLWAS
jgi:hypothetical protein